MYVALVTDIIHKEDKPVFATNSLLSVYSYTVNQ